MSAKPPKYNTVEDVIGHTPLVRRVRRWVALRDLGLCHGGIPQPPSGPVAADTIGGRR